MTQSIFEQHDILDQLFVELKRIYQAGQTPRYDTLRHIAPTLTYAEYELVIERFVGYVRSHEWQQFKEHEDKLKQEQPTWPQDLMADALNFEQDLVRSLGRFLKEREHKLAQAMSARVKELELLTQDLQTQLKESNVQRHQQQDELTRYNTAIERLKAVYNTQRAFMSQGQHDSEALELMAQALQGNEQGLSPELKDISAKLSPEIKTKVWSLVQAAKLQANTSGHRAPALPDIDDLLRAPQPAAKPAIKPQEPAAQPTPSQPAAAAAATQAAAPVTATPAAAPTNSYQEVFALIAQTSTDYLNSKSEDQDLTSLDLEEIGNKLIAHPLVLQAKLTEAQLKRLIIKSVFLYTEPLTEADLTASDEELVAALPSDQDKFFARGMLTFAHLGSSKSESNLSPATAIAMSAPLKESPKATPITTALLERPVSAATAIVRSNRSAEGLSNNSAQEGTAQAPLIDLTQSDLLAEGLAPADALEQLKEQQAAQLLAKAQAKADALKQGASLALGPEGKTPFFNEPAELLNSVTPKSLPRDESTLLPDMAQSKGTDSIAAFAAASAKLESLAPMLHEASRDLSQAKAEFDAALGQPPAPKAQASKAQAPAEPKQAQSSFWAQNMSDIWAGTEGGANVGAKAVTESTTTSAIASVAQDVLKVAAKLERDTDEKLKQEKKQSLFANSYFTGGAVNEPSNEPVNATEDDDFIAGNASDAEPQAQKPTKAPAGPAATSVNQAASSVSPAAGGAAKEHPRTTAPLTTAQAQRPAPVTPAAVKQDLSQHTSIIINHDALKHQHVSGAGKIALKSLSDNTAIVRSQAPQSLPPIAKQVAPKAAPKPQQPALAHSTEHTTIVRGPAVPSAAATAAAAVTGAAAAASTAATVSTAAAAASATAATTAAGAASPAGTSAAQTCLKQLGTLLDLKPQQRTSVPNQLPNQRQDGTAVELKSLAHFYENCIAGLTQQFKLSSALAQALKTRMEQDLNDLSHHGEQRIKSLGPVSEDRVTADLKQALTQLTASPSAIPAPAPSVEAQVADTPAEPTPSAAEPAHGAHMRLLTEDETRDAEYQAHPVHGLNTFVVVDDAMSYEESLEQHQSIDQRVNRGLTKKVNPKKLEALRAKRQKEEQERKPDAPRPFHELNFASIIETQLELFREQERKEQQNPELKEQNKNAPGMVFFAKLNDSGEAVIQGLEGLPETTNPSSKATSFTLVEDDGSDSERSAEPSTESGAVSAPKSNVLVLMPTPPDEASPADGAPKLEAPVMAQLPDYAAPASKLAAPVEPQLEAPVMPELTAYVAPLKAPVVPELPAYFAPLKAPVMAQLPEYFAPLKAPVMAQLPKYFAPLKAPVMAQLPEYFAPLKAPVVPELPAYVAPLQAPVLAQLPEYVAPEPVPVAPEPEVAPAEPTPVAPATVAAEPQASAEDDDEDGLFITPASAYATPTGAASGNPLSVNESNTLWPNSMTSYSFSLGPNNGAAILGGAFGTGFGLGSGSGSGK